MNDTPKDNSISEPLPTVRPPDAAAKITARNINFYYGETRTLKDVSLVIQEKRVTALIGPSGCGKSTLLRIFNRMYAIYPKQRAEGEILLDGENVLSPALFDQSAAHESGHGVSESRCRSPCRSTTMWHMRCVIMRNCRA